MSFILTREQVRRVDELAVRKYGMCGLVLMENAGRNAAEIIDREFGLRAPASGAASVSTSFGAAGPGAPGPVNAEFAAPRGRAVIFCGTGNNGGDGCVIARHLHNAGWHVRLAIAGEEARMSPDMLANFRIVEAMRLDIFCMADQGDRISACDSIAAGEVVIDALLGTGFRGMMREDLAELIAGMNQRVDELRAIVARKADQPHSAVVAVDVPSGLDCDTGEPGGVAIRADLTITFVASKVGFENREARVYTGRVDVADIGAPRELIEQVASSVIMKSNKR